MSDLDRVRKVLASDQSLVCSFCGKKPLLKKDDVIPYGPAFSGGDDAINARLKKQGFHSVEEVQALIDRTTYERGVKCTSCGSVSCVACLSSRGKPFGNGKGCPSCGSRVDIL